MQIHNVNLILLVNNVFIPIFIKVSYESTIIILKICNLFIPFLQISVFQICFVIELKNFITFHKRIVSAIFKIREERITAGKNLSFCEPLVRSPAVKE